MPEGKEVVIRKSRQVLVRGIDVQPWGCMSSCRKVKLVVCIDKSGYAFVVPTLDLTRITYN